MTNAYAIGGLILFVLAISFAPMMATPSIPLPFTSGVMSTGSMVPAINVGDLFLVDRTVGFSDIVVGDIVMFRGNTFQPVSHRVLAHDGFEMTTKGDANPFNDAPVTKSTYLGVVVGVVPTHMLGPTGYVVGTALTLTGILSIASLFLFYVHFRGRRIR